MKLFSFIRVYLRSFAAISLFLAIAFAGPLSDLKPLALKGDVPAQLKLARAYEHGQGVPQDFAEAAKWFRLAAEKGDIEAQRYMGFACRTGQGVSKNYFESAKWYVMAESQKWSKK